MHNDKRAEALLVDPLSLLIFGHQFYVLSRRSDASLYCYRFARMSEVDATEARFAYPSKGEYDPRNVLEPSFGVHISGTGPAEDVAVLVEGGWAANASKHRWHPSQTIEIHDDAKVTVRMRVRLCPELETWALTFGEHATVLRPAKLREAVATRLARVAQRYEKEVQAAGRGKLARR